MPIQSALAPPIQQATVELWSQPTGADVEIDGEYVGGTFSKIAIPQGDHTITIRKKDFMTCQVAIRLKPEYVRLAAYMEREAYTIHIEH